MTRKIALGMAVGSLLSLLAGCGETPGTRAVTGGLLVADRYVAYRAIDKVKTGQIILALCWAHQRRDFVELGRSRPEQHEWALDWLQRIRTIYQLNERRLELREDSEGFAQRDLDLRAAVTAGADDLRAVAL